MRFDGALVLCKTFLFEGALAAGRTTSITHIHSLPAGIDATACSQTPIEFLLFSS